MFLFADLAAYFWNFLARALAALDAVLLGHFSRSLWSLLDIVLQYFRTANQAFPMDNSDSVTSISGFHACIHPSSNVFSWDLPISQKLNSRGYTSLAVVFWVTDGKNILVPSACVGLWARGLLKISIHCMAACTGLGFFFRIMAQFIWEQKKSS